MAAWNTTQVRELNNYFDFEGMLVEDANCLTWDKELDQLSHFAHDFELVV